jgi:hypothetical protein
LRSRVRICVLLLAAASRGLVSPAGWAQGWQAGRLAGWQAGRRVGLLDMGAGTVCDVRWGRGLLVFGAPGVFGWAVSVSSVVLSLRWPLPWSYGLELH